MKLYTLDRDELEKAMALAVEVALNDLAEKKLLTQEAVIEHVKSRRPIITERNCLISWVAEKVFKKENTFFITMGDVPKEAKP